MCHVSCPSNMGFARLDPGLWEMANCPMLFSLFSSFQENTKPIFNFALHCIALHCIALHCIALHCIALHCIALHCIALHCIALHCIALHCIALHCIALHCIALHCYSVISRTDLAPHPVAWGIIVGL